MTKIKNKVFLVTGASSGIGEALVYQLVQKGAKLIISARRKEELERVKSNCPEGSDIQILTLDLADGFSIPQKAKEAESYHGHIDVLINCGGVSNRDRAIENKIEVDRKIMEINYFGAITLSKALLPKMIQRQSGHQVVITSASGKIGIPNRSAYAASKHALHGFYDALRAEHWKDKLKVTLILPGYIRTQISYNALLGDGTKQNKMDSAQDQGISAEECAKKIIKAIEANKEELYIGGFQEVAAIYIKRFFPGLFSKIARKRSVS